MTAVNNPRHRPPSSEVNETFSKVHEILAMNSKTVSLLSKVSIQWKYNQAGFDPSCTHGPWTVVLIPCS